MDVLPINKIREEDSPLVGTEIVYLARLSQLGFPVAPGLVVIPPEIKIKTILRKYNLHEREVFEQSLTIIKKEMEEIPEPPELRSAFLEHGSEVDTHRLWLDLLEIWLQELRSKVWREGFSPNLQESFSAQSVFLTGKIASSGKAWASGDKVKVELGEGGLTDKQSEDLKQLVVDGNKKLLLPQIYYWVVEGKSPKVLLTKLVPFSGETEETSGEFPLEQKKSEGQPSPKSASKVFLDLSKGLVINHDVEGVLISAEQVLEEVNGIKDKFEALVFRLVEAASAFPDKVVIFKLSDKIENRGGVRGSLRLIHQESLLREETEAFLFARKKKNLSNLQVGVPFVRSVNEFLEMKRSLAVKGISRKGSSKIWLELCVPENFINIDEYILAGCDGVILQLDELSQWLGGFDSDIPESVFYQKQIKALLAFLAPPLKTLHQAKLPVLACGKLSLDDEVLSFLIEKGIYGVVADRVTSESLHEHLRFVEKRVIRKR